MELLLGTILTSNIMVIRRTRLRKCLHYNTIDLLVSDERQGEQLTNAESSHGSSFSSWTGPPRLIPLIHRSIPSSKYRFCQQKDVCSKRTCAPIRSGDGIVTKHSFSRSLPKICGRSGALTPSTRVCWRPGICMKEEKKEEEKKKDAKNLWRWNAVGPREIMRPSRDSQSGSASTSFSELMRLRY